MNTTVVYRPSAPLYNGRFALHSTGNDGVANVPGELYTSSVFFTAGSLLG